MELMGILFHGKIKNVKELYIFLVTSDIAEK